MKFARTIALACIYSLAGCSEESPEPPAVANQPAVQSSEPIAAEPPLPGMPKYNATIWVNAAKEGEGRMKCASDLGQLGTLKCGPESALTEVSWKFVEHLNGLDYYDFNWTLHSNGKPMKFANAHRGIDGVSEATRIDDEPNIIVRKGALKRADAEAK